MRRKRNSPAQLPVSSSEVGASSSPASTDKGVLRDVRHVGPSLSLIKAKLPHSRNTGVLKTYMYEFAIGT